jgi:nucleotide-binding universal stress UspA family protein
MYQKILVALENGPSDETLLPHISDLAKVHTSRLLLLHVADGWVARNYDRLQLAESQEMKEDRAYLDKAAEGMREKGLAVETMLALGDPATEILKAAQEQQCDLIAMTTHGHGLIADIVYGSTINEVRHKAPMPVLLVRAMKPV